MGVKKLWSEGAGCPLLKSARLLCTPAFVQYTITKKFAGCSLVARAPALGAGDRRFESSHPEAFIAQLDRAAAF